MMYALLTVFDKRGYPAPVTAKNETIVRVLEESFQIALTERFKQVMVSTRTVKAWTWSRLVA